MRNTIVLSVIILSFFSLWAHADLTAFPVCTQGDSQSDPSVSGEIVVWTDDRSGLDVYGYDLNTQTELNSLQLYRGSPAISNDIVVCGDSDISGYNLITQTAFPICTQTNTQDTPAIDANIVVWRDKRNAIPHFDQSDIYGYDLNTQSEFPICTESNWQSCPAVSGDIVVWQDDRNGNYHIYGYILSTQKEFSLSTQSSPQYTPSISGNIVVWVDYRNGDADIYGYDLNTHIEFPVCTQNESQSDPDINGDVIVWKDRRNFNDDIYGYNLKTQTEFPVCTESSNQYNPSVNGNVVVWQDERNDNTDIYGAFLEGRTFSSSDTCEVGLYINENEPFLGSNVNATGTDISSCAYNDVYDVWNRYIPSQGGTVTITTDGSTFDTVLSVYEACGSTELACNDDYTFDNPQSKIVMDVVKGKTYYIRVAGFNGEVGDYDLLVTHGDCSNRPQSDIDGNCKVDLLDFVIMASEWLSCGYSDPGDC